MTTASATQPITDCTGKEIVVGSRLALLGDGDTHTYRVTSLTPTGFFIKANGPGEPTEVDESLASFFRIMP